MKIINTENLEKVVNAVHQIFADEELSKMEEDVVLGQLVRERKLDEQFSNNDAIAEQVKKLLKK